jgi:hypothetical protein
MVQVEKEMIRRWENIRKKGHKAGEVVVVYTESAVGRETGGGGAV